MKFLNITKQKVYFNGTDEKEITVLIGAGAVIEASKYGAMTKTITGAVLDEAISHPEYMHLVKELRTLQHQRFPLDLKVRLNQLLLVYGLS